MCHDEGTTLAGNAQGGCFDLDCWFQLCFNCWSCGCTMLSSQAKNWIVFDVMRSLRLWWILQVTVKDLKIYLVARKIPCVLISILVGLLQFLIRRAMCRFLPSTIIVRPTYLTTKQQPPYTWHQISIWGYCAGCLLSYFFRTCKRWVLWLWVVSSKVCQGPAIIVSIPFRVYSFCCC